MNQGKLITVLDGVTLMTYDTSLGISDIAEELQKSANDSGSPTAILHDGVTLLAFPGGDTAVLVKGYYEATTARSNYGIQAGTITKFPKLLDWVRSISFPGEKYLDKRKNSE